VLPPALRLDIVPNGDRNRHPIVFIFGEHYRSKVFFASLALPTDVRFRELVIAVPFVRTRRGMGPAVFLPRVFSGEAVVTWSGNAHYGFAKRMVPMEWFGNTFVATDEDGGLLAHATVEPLEAWRPAARNGRPGLVGAESLGRLPILGHLADGRLVRSVFDWGFEDAWLRTVRATVSIDATVGQGIVPRRSNCASAGCVEVAGMRWRLSWPDYAY